MANDTIDSISEFLLHAGTQYQVYDLSRGLTTIDTQTFLALENANIPCPRPRQSKIWLAISFAQASATVQQMPKHFLWFIALPLDEESHIIQASRNHFLQLIIEALQANAQLEQGLPDNPYVFTPSQTQRGQLSTLINHSLYNTAESRSKQVVGYLTAPSTVDWRKLVMQDIYFAALHVNNNAALTERVKDNWDKLATEVQHTLLKAWEPIPLSEALKHFLLSRFELCINQEQQQLYLLALSELDVQINYQALLAKLLSDTQTIDMHLLSIIAGRYYTQFTPALIRLFFQACIHLDETENRDGELFAGFYRDLVAIPTLRQEAIVALNEFRNRGE